MFGLKSKRHQNSSTSRPNPRWRRINRAMLAVFVLIGLFAAGWAYGWSAVREEVLQTDPYTISRDDIVISTPPDWIQCDVLGDALRQAGIENDDTVSLLDPKLSEILAAALAMHPWVERVVRVEKKYPAALSIELEYRRPVLMVRSHDRLWPVDGRGTVLPHEYFDPRVANEFPRLLGVESLPRDSDGLSWGDIRVAEAAKIVAMIGDQWDRLRLYRIRVEPSIEKENRYEYIISTRGGSLIYWGIVDKADEPIDPVSEAKVKWLVNCFDECGTLEGVHGPQPIDLRGIRAE